MIEYKIKNTSDKFDIAKCRESAESGYAPAQYQLGQCYEDGIGVQRNLAKAFRWYWLAADNSRPAQERLKKDSYQGQLAKWLRKTGRVMVCHGGGTGSRFKNMLITVRY